MNTENTLTENQYKLIFDYLNFNTGSFQQYVADELGIEGLNARFDKAFEITEQAENRNLEKRYYKLIANYLAKEYRSFETYVRNADFPAMNAEIIIKKLRVKYS